MSITCSPSKKSRRVRRSAAWEVAGLLMPVGVPDRADDAELGLGEFEHEIIATAIADTTSSLNPWSS